MEYFPESDPFLKLWSMPHPIVYILGVSREAEALKIIMHRYCTEIQETKAQREKIQKTLFERKASKTLGLWLRRMQSLEAKEQSLRKSFELARGLWMLEHNLLLTYEAITRWRRAKDGADANTGEDTRSEDCQQEEAENAACYEECGYEQASVSRDIRALLEAEEPSVGCDEPMRWYFQEKYCACQDCNYYFAKRDLGILGLIRRGDQWTSSISFDEDGEDPFDSFYCIECFKNVGCGGPLPSNHESTEAASTNCADHGTFENSNTKNGTTSSTPKKRRKKKKKKKVHDSLSHQLITTCILSSSCPSPTSVVPDCMESPTCEDEMSMQEGPGLEAGNVFLMALEDAKNDDDDDDDDKYYNKEVFPEDPNELWVDYLVKTGSIIALDKYMDEMEPILGITTH